MVQEQSKVSAAQLQILDLEDAADAAAVKARQADGQVAAAQRAFEAATSVLAQAQAALEVAKGSEARNAAAAALSAAFARSQVRAADIGSAVCVCMRSRLRGALLGAGRGAAKPGAHTGPRDSHVALRPHGRSVMKRHAQQQPFAGETVALLSSDSVLLPAYSVCSKPPGRTRQQLPGSWLHARRPRRRSRSWPH